MTATWDYRPTAYLIILLGTGAACAASIVPFYNAGYKLDTTVLLAVLAPFVVYGTLLESLRGPWVIASGVVVLAVSAAEVIIERFLAYNGYKDESIYWVPMAAAAIVLAVAYALGRRKEE